MSVATRSKSKRRRTARTSVHKPNGVLQERVQKASPERFGVVSIDVGKGKSEWMLCDFYGKVLIEPTEVTHTRCGFELALIQLRDALTEHRIQDQVIAIERTGNYHLPVKRAFAAAGFETRIVHPFATKQFRQPADPGVKTDENDLHAIFRATITGFGLLEPELDEVSRRLRLLTRHRRDLVEKRSALCCQIREHLDALLPGYASLFDDLWESAIAVPLARQFPSAEAMRQAGAPGMRKWLREAKIAACESVLQRIMSWSTNAATPGDDRALHERIWFSLESDRTEKTREIQALERDIAGLLVQTPYVLLLSHPGINVVTAGELAGEMGPITHYANAKAITGRAGIFPSRYQSVDVDTPGDLIRCSNRHLRAILMMIADNLITCNLHFRALHAQWKSQGKDARWSRVKVACRFSRIAFQMVAGRQVFCHPSQRERSYILDKLLDFHRQHRTPPEMILTDLNRAILQIPTSEHPSEATPLQTHVVPKHRKRRDAQPIGEILLVVLARLGVGTVESEAEVRNPS